MNSYLFTPALKIDSLKSQNLPKGQSIVLDLEDSIQLNNKEKAREHLSNFDFSQLTEFNFHWSIRLNSIGTYSGLSDLQWLKKMLGNQDFPVTQLFLPKLNNVEELLLYKKLVVTLPRALNLIAIIESIDGVENLDAIAEQCDGLIFGQADLVGQLYAPNQNFITAARMKLCVAAAKYQIQAFDTNSFELNDMQKLHQECVQAKAEGFMGKAVIHPKQIRTVEKVFAINQTLLKEYQAVIDDYKLAEDGFIVNKDKVVAPPFVAKAETMLNYALKYHKFYENTHEK